MYPPFRQGGNTVTLSATTSSVSGSVPVAGGEMLIITNTGTTPVFFRTGSGSATALTTDLPILPGSAVTVTRPTTHDYAAVITGTGTATVYVTPGWGQ